MEDLKNTPVGEIVRMDFRAADVFSSFGIDFCCGGKISVEQACFEKNSKLDEVIEKLTKLQNDTVLPSLDFNSWNLGFLIDYIKNTHHQYVVTETPVILQYADKVADVHGDTHPETKEIANLFHQLADELKTHMEHEETVLFPSVKKLLDPKNKPITDSHNFPITELEEEHEVAGAILKQLSTLSNGYTFPEDACNTFRVLYGKLKEFEKDLHQHVHLENNILFPKTELLMKESV